MEWPLRHGRDMKRPPSRSLPAAVVCASLAACSGAPGDVIGDDSTAVSGSEVNVWITTDPNDPFRHGAALAFGAPANVPGSVGTLAIDESSGNLRAKVDGFGAALTDASAAIIYHYVSHGHRSSPQQTRLLEKLLSPTKGIGLSIVRVPIAASDSTWDGAYSYDDVPGDTGMQHFSVSHDEQYIIPELQEIVGSINPSVHVIVTPWSPPAWMKNGTTTMVGGTLEPKYRQPYAEYLVRFVHAYQGAKPSIPIYGIVPQNEPDGKTPETGQPADYPSMTFPPADESAFIANHLAPTMRKAGLGGVKIFGFDHNWGDAYPEDLLGDLQNDGALADLAGLSFHCYGGNHSGALSKIHADARMSGKEIYLTECDRSVYDSNGTLKSYAEGIQKLIYALDNWSRSYLAWQLVLEPNGKPNQGHGCMGSDWHCQGVVSVDQAGRVTNEWDYAYLGHASKFVRRGAQVVHTGSVGPVDAIAFINPDGGRALVAYNASGQSAKFEVVWHGQAFTASIPAHGVATFAWGKAA